MLSSSSLLPFSTFHKINRASCAVKRYNFFHLPSISVRRSTKRKSVGHKHLGKFTPCPLSLMENKLASLAKLMLQQKLLLCSL